MRIYGTIKELVAAVFKKDTREITLRPNQGVTYNAAVDIQLPPSIATTQVLVSEAATQTLTNKTFDADGTGNSITNIENADIKAAANIARTKLASGSANHVIINDGTGVFSSEAQLATSRGGTGVNSTATFPTSGTVTTDAGATTLTNKTISGASNTLSNISLTSSVTGTLPIGSGGTGQTTANTALNALLPSQTSNSGKVLSTDGSNSSWAAVASSTQNQYTVDIGDSANTRTATNTNLLGDIKASTSSATITLTIATPAVVTHTSHGLSTGDSVYFTTTGALPAGVSASTKYYIIKIDANSYNVCTSLANVVSATKIATSGSQSGTHTAFVGGLAHTPGTVRGLLDGTTISGGYVGQKISSEVGFGAGWPSASTNWGDMASVTLTPGVWLMFGTTAVASNGATISSAADFGFGTASGNDSTGFNLAQNGTRITVGTALTGMTVYQYVNISSSAPYYLKTRLTYSGASPQYGCSLTAVRIA